MAQPLAPYPAPPPPLAPLASACLRQVDPALLGLSEGTGAPPSKAFATLPACRAIPGAAVSLVSTMTGASSPSSSSVARSGGVLSRARGGGGGNGREKDGEEEEEEDEVLEVRPPPGSGGKALRLRVLDGVSLRVSETAILSPLPSPGNEQRRSHPRIDGSVAHRKVFRSPYRRPFAVPARSPGVASPCATSVASLVPPLPRPASTRQCFLPRKIRLILTPPAFFLPAAPPGRLPCPLTLCSCPARCCRPKRGSQR